MQLFIKYIYLLKTATTRTLALPCLTGVVLHCHSIVTALAPNGVVSDQSFLSFRGRDCISVFASPGPWCRTCLPLEILSKSSFGKGDTLKRAQGTAALRTDRGELDLEWLGFLLYMFTQQMFYLNYFNIYNFRWITHLSHIKQYVRHDLVFPWFLSSCWRHQIFNLALGEGDLSHPHPWLGSSAAPWCWFLQLGFPSSSSDKAVDFPSWYYHFACVYSFWSFMVRKLEYLDF